MSTRNDGGSAFPTHGCGPGMSQREWFAGMALMGLIAAGPHDCDASGVCHDAYLYADAMLAEGRKATP